MSSWRADASPRWPVVVCVGERVVGLGLWVTAEIVLTCAHVLDPARPDSPPEGSLAVASLFGEGRPVEGGTVTGWDPSALDIALVSFPFQGDGSWLPELRYPERLGIAQGTHSWRAWGVPSTAIGAMPKSLSREGALRRVRASVRVGSGTVSDTLGPHRYQLRTDGEPAFESGFSGSAVRGDGNRVIGILTSRAGRESTSRIGFLTSVDGIVDRFPHLGQHVGWSYARDSALQAAWRWEDDEQARPALGAHFSGRTGVLSELARVVANG